MGVIIGLTGDRHVMSVVLFLLKIGPGEIISLACELIAANVGCGRGRKGDRLG